MTNGVVALLIADDAVTALIDDRVYPVVAEQADLRGYVTINRTGVTPTIVKNEVSDKDEVIFNVVSHSKTYKECLQISQACRTVVDNYKGTSDGVEFKNIWYQSSQDLFEPDEQTYIIIDSYAARVKR